MQILAAPTPTDDAEPDELEVVVHFGDGREERARQIELLLEEAEHLDSPHRKGDRRAHAGQEEVEEELPRRVHGSPAVGVSGGRKKREGRGERERERKRQIG